MVVRNSASSHGWEMRASSAAGFLCDARAVDGAGAMYQTASPVRRRALDHVVLILGTAVGEFCIRMVVGGFVAHA